VDSAGYVATARAGAPANGLRFIVYGIDPFTGDPLVPLVETGYVDLMDESTATSGRLHILVQSVGGAATFLDYTATGTPSATGGTISAAGFVSNGQAGSALRRLDFDVAVTYSQTFSTLTIGLVAAFDVNQPDVSIDLSWDYELGQTGRTETVRFSFQRAGEVIIIEGVYTNTQAGSSYDFEVRVNGGLFATITGDASGVQILDENGDPLTQAEIACLQALFIGWQEVVDLALDILAPLALGSPLIAGGPALCRRRGRNTRGRRYPMRTLPGRPAPLPALVAAPRGVRIRTAPPDQRSGRSCGAHARHRQHRRIAQANGTLVRLPPPRDAAGLPRHAARPHVRM
jgi:hypothetical protein